MGGNKKAPRTKGNVRPSSSGRSAQLLSATGAAGLSGFVGFSSLSTESPAYIPPTGQHVIDDGDSTVDSDFRMVMRKLTKRDQTTRLKALQELLDLVKEKDVELIKGALPFWPRLYNKLSLDNDRRVREATHRVHELICQRVRRDLAPHTKGLIGAWLVSQSDPFAPAASAAKAAFEAAFSAEKQMQVFQFFHQELFSYISDVILQQTTDTLPDSKELSPEEREAKYHRWLSCALLGLKMVLEYLTPLPEPCLESLDAIVKEPKFWKMAKHKDTMVRKSWYSLVSTLSRVEHVCSMYGAKLCSLTLGSLAENDPVVAVPIWEAALSVVSAVQDCWSHVDARKAVLPQLWKVLKAGGFGSAVHIYPNLLPFLSLVPAEVVGGGVQFYKLFFDAFREGLLSPKVQASVAECNAVIQAFMECLRYVLTRHLARDESATAVRNHVLQEQLLEVLKTCLTDVSSRLSGTRLYYDVASLHSFLLQKCLAADTEPTAKTSYEECLQLVWGRLLELSLEIVALSPPNATLLRRLTKLLCAVHAPPASPRSQMKVTLVAPDDARSAAQSRKSSLPSLNIRSSALEALPTAMANTTKVCAEVLGKARAKPGSNESLVYLEAASELMRASVSAGFIEAVLTELGAACDTGNSPVSRFFGLFQSLLVEVGHQDCSEEYYRRVGDCLLIASLSTSAAEAVELFNSTVLDHGHLLAVFLERALDCWKSHAGIQEWLRSGPLAQKLLQLSAKLVPSSTSESELLWRSLRASLEMGNLPEPLISLSNLSSILSTLRKTLQGFTQAEGKDLLKAVDFVCEITNTLFSSYEGCCNLPESEEFVFALFLLDCHNTLCSTPETQEKVCWSWQQGISMIVKARGGFLTPGGLLHKISSALNATSLTCLSEDKRQGLVRCCCRFLESIFAAIPKEEQDPVALLLDPTVSLVLESILPTSQQWEQLVENTHLSELIAEHLEHPEDHPLYTTQDYLSKQASSQQSLDQAHLAEVAGFTEAVFDHLLTSECDAEAKPLKSSSLLLKCAPFLILARCFPNRQFANACEDKGEDLKKQSALNNAIETFSNDIFDSLVSRAVSGENVWLEALVYFLRRLTEDGIARRICDSYYIASKDNLYKHENRMELLVMRSLLPFVSDNHIEEVFVTCVRYLKSWEVERGWAVAVDLLGLASKALQGLSPTQMESAHEGVVSILYWLQGARGSQPKLYLRDEAAGLSEDEFEWSRMACHFYRTVLGHCPESLTPCNWDFVLLSIAMWNQRFSWRRAVELFSTREIVFTCELLSCLLQAAHVTDKSQPTRERCKLPESFDVEWEEFYTRTVFSVLIPGFIDIAHLSTCPNETASVLLKKLASALEFASEKRVVEFVESFQNRQEPNPQSLNSLLSKLTPLATSKSLALQLGAHTLLQKIMPVVAKEEAQGIEKQDSDETSRSPPEPLLSSLLEMGQVVEVLLSDFDLGDCCLVEAGTDSYTYTLGYLLSWLDLLAFFGASPAEARSEYASYLQEEGLLSCLLEHLFCLMPSNVGLSSKGTTMFTEPARLSPHEEFSPTKLQHIACQVYLDAICKLPAMVRAWWGSQNKRVMDHVEKFTSHHVTGVISSREIQAVQNADVSLENMTVRGRPSAREVVATYTIEEVTIELVVKLPANHPLGVVTIDSGRRVGVNQSQWRHWLLQLTTFLTHQNGSIMDGLALWKRNVDKRFEGVEECMICFYVLHGATCQLPKLSCRTCKKRFHSACLFKWFNTSNNSTCPLCRNVF